MLVSSLPPPNLLLEQSREVEDRTLFLQEIAI